MEKKQKKNPSNHNREFKKPAQIKLIHQILAKNTHKKIPSNHNREFIKPAQIKLIHQNLAKNTQRKFRQITTGNFQKSFSICHSDRRDRILED